MDRAGFGTVGARRRVGEKIGRSLVALNDVNGIDHKGLLSPVDPGFPPLPGKAPVGGPAPRLTTAGSDICCEAALTRPQKVIKATKITRLKLRIARDRIILFPSIVL